MGTVFASPEEQVFSNAIRAFRPNAFRILSLAADADSSWIDRQAGRLLVAIELDPARSEGACGLKDLTSFEISEAVHLLDQPDARMLEELFWVHAVAYDLQAGSAEVLRAARRQPEDSIASHNLAVLLTIYAQEVDPGTWEEALAQWKQVLGDLHFWQFMKGRAATLGAAKSSPPKLAAAVTHSLTEALHGQMAQAARAKEVKLLALLVRALQPHRDWLDLEATLNATATPLLKDAFVSLGVVHDQLAELRPDTAKASLDRSLAAIEEKVGCVVADYVDLRCSLEEPASEEDWEKALCSTYQRLMLALFDLQGDVEAAQRVKQQAEGFISRPSLLEPLRRDWQHILASGLIREAEALLRAGNYNATDQKLDEMWGVASEQQKNQIETLRETCGFARAAQEKQERLQQLERGQQDPAAAEMDDRGSRPVPSPMRWRAVWMIVAVAVAFVVGTALFAGHTQSPQVPPPHGPGTLAPPAIAPPPVERHSLVALEQTLATTRNELETEGLELEKQRRNLEAVTAAYQGQAVPQDAQQVYEQLLTDYNKRVLQHNKGLAQWQKDDAEYRSRLSALQAHEEVAKR